MNIEIKPDGVTLRRHGEVIAKAPLDETQISTYGFVTNISYLFPMLQIAANQPVGVGE